MEVFKPYAFSHQFPPPALSLLLTRNLPLAPPTPFTPAQLKALQASKAQAEEQAALRLRIVNSTAGSLRAAAKSLSREHAALRAQQAQLAEAVPEMLAHVQEEVEGFMASVDMASVEQLRALYQAEVRVTPLRARPPRSFPPLERRRVA